MSNKLRMVKFLMAAVLAAGALGIFSAYANRRGATTWARSMLGAAGTLASPGVLIVLGLATCLLWSLAKKHPESWWQGPWKYCKFFWKVYAWLTLALVTFVLLVALSNLMGLSHR